MKRRSTESVKTQFILPKDLILIRLRVFHFMAPNTCSVFVNWKLCTILGSLELYILNKIVFFVQLGH